MSGNSPKTADVRGVKYVVELLYSCRLVKIKYKII